VHVYNYLLLDNSLYQCEVTLFVSSNFVLKYALSGMNIATPACFQAPFACKVFFYPFILSLCLSLHLAGNKCSGLVF
jgi:hypothetical protein